jgi:hypothetical protein
MLCSDNKINKKENEKICFLIDLKINFENKIKIDNKTHLNLILMLKNKFFYKKKNSKLDLIGCGAFQSYIYNS